MQRRSNYRHIQAIRAYDRYGRMIAEQKKQEAKKKRKREEKNEG